MSLRKGFSWGTHRPSLRALALISRNMVMLGEPNVSRFIGLLDEFVLYNLLYLELVRYMFFICSFIPVWVFVVMLGQVLKCYGVVALSSEDRLVEFVWTFIPTLLTAVLCFLNLQYISYERVLPDSKVVKVVGHQWY